jgi:hypothetical protein
MISRQDNQGVSDITEKLKVANAVQGMNLHQQN